MSNSNILILGINGSPHKNGRCAKLLKQTLKSCEKHDAKTKLVHLANEEKEFFHSYYSRKPEKDFVKLYNMLLEADGFILATPVNWMNVSTLMKNFIDKLTVLVANNYRLEGKAAGFIATEEQCGSVEALNAMAFPLNHMGVLTPPYSTLFYNFSLKRNSETEWMDKDFDLLGKNLVTLCEILKSTKPNWDYGKKYKE